MQKHRYAIRVFYDGKNFHGSQIQPKLRTVEGEFQKALKKFCNFENFQRASRTDAKVSAFGNVFALTTNFKLEPRIINAHLPCDIRAIAVKEVSKDFNPRFAKERIYKYFLFDDGYDLKKIKEAARIIKGKHSFHNFTALQEGCKIKKVNYVEVEKEGDIIILTFSAESFLWEMVRRLVTALKMVGKHELGMEEFFEFFDINVRKKIKASPPEFLILWDVKYDFEFEYEDYSLQKFIEELKKEYAMLKMKEKILKAIL